MALIWALGQQHFEPAADLAHPGGGLTEPRHFHLHPSDPTIVIQSHRDGMDFIKVCGRHQWASVPMPGHAPACPLCIAEYDEVDGRSRYVVLHRALAEGR